MSKGKGFFEESRGNKSATRLTTVSSLFAALVISFMVVNSDDPQRVEIYLIFGLLAYSSGKKVFSKYAEKKVKPVNLTNKTKTNE